MTILGNDGDYVNMEADAILFNPNSASGRVKSIQLEVFFKDNKIAQIQELSDVKIAANSRFEVPLQMKLDMAKIQSNWLENLAGILRNRSLDLRFKGQIVLKIHGFSRRIPVDYVHQITL